MKFILRKCIVVNIVILTLFFFFITACGNNKEDQLGMAISCNNMEEVVSLLKGGVNVNGTGTQKDGYSAIHWASQNGNVKMMFVLLRYGADVNFKDHGGDTPLHMAAMLDHAECVNFLLKNGANPNTKNGAGLTPLDSAVKLKCQNTIKALTGFSY